MHFVNTLLMHCVRKNFVDTLRKYFVDAVIFCQMSDFLRNAQTNMYTPLNDLEKMVRGGIDISTWVIIHQQRVEAEQSVVNLNVFLQSRTQTPEVHVHHIYIYYISYPHRIHELDFDVTHNGLCKQNGQRARGRKRLPSIH